MENRSDFCALCFSHETKLMDIKHAGLSFKIKFNFLFRLDLEVSSNINIYRHVCTCCVNKIEDFYEFYVEVLKNYNKLKKTVAIYTSDAKNSNESNTLVHQAIEAQSNCNTQLGHAIKIEEEEQVKLPLYELGLHKKQILKNQCSIKHNSDPNLSEEDHKHTKDQTNDLELEELSKLRGDTSKIENHETFSENILKIDIPDHLKVRTPKKISDAKIRSFMDLICELCDEKSQFNTFKEMQLHYESQHETRGFIRCCGKKIYRKDRAMDHITLHMNPAAFKCPECGQRSKSKVLLRIHMKQHLPVDERPFQCKVCDQKFVLRSQLSNHQATHLSADEKKYVCDECGKAFALKFVLLKHKVTHTPEKPYFCDVCARTFASKGNLTSHVQTHIREPQPRVQCEECGHWYKNQQTLRSHTHRHRDTRDHECNICTKKCSSKSSLLQHIKYVHQKIKNFECNICQKQFRRRPELTEHVARHTGEMLYKCQYCPRTFFSSSNFFAHRKTKHPEEYATLNQQKQA